MNIKQICGLSILVILILLLTTSAALAKPQEKTYIVDSNGGASDANPGDGVCATGTGHCTLVAAIQESNLDADASVIKFAYYFQSPNDFDGCSLPDITADNTTIDASEKWDQANNRPGVEISGGGCELLKISANNTTVLGIFFGGSSTGVYIINGGHNSIGGSETGQRNVFITDMGVRVQSSADNTISHNYIGTITGESTTPISGGHGVYIQSNGPNVVSNNLIAGQDRGIMIWGNNNLVHDNIIGMNPSKSKALPNNVGILLSWADNNVVGPGNYIGGNNSHGIELYHAQDNTVTGNFIGNSSNLGNGEHGVYANITANNLIEKNTISNNTGHGISVYASNGFTIKGNGIYFSGQNGLYVENTSGGEVGGTGAQAHNFIYGNVGHGIHLNNGSSITVVANYIGRDDWSTYGFCDTPNQGHGVLIDNGSANNVIGGDLVSQRNWIAYNGLNGIHLSGSTTQNNFVLNNLLGAPDDWCVLPKYGHHGIAIYNGAHNNSIGGLSAGNIILGAGWSGIAVVDSSENAIIGNRIGTDGRISNAGNNFYGVHIVGSGLDNILTFNEIAYNGTIDGMDGQQAGIQVDGSGSNTISQNSIHDNDGPGIELVNNGNNNLAAPAITQASCEGPISGTSGGANWRIEIFSDYGDEGRTFEAQVTTDSLGKWTWDGDPNGPYLTATARDQSNNTSPFSAPFQIGTCVGKEVFLPLMTK